MKYKVRFVLPLLALAMAVPAFAANDQEKAEKEIKMVSSIAVDASTRSIVNRSEAELLGVKRLDLVKERQAMNIPYGTLLVAHELVSAGAKMDDIAAQLKAGKSIFDIANDQHANWKQIASEAKKLNKKIDDNLVKHFQNAKGEKERDTADDYDAQADRVPVDSAVSKDDFAGAQTRYQRDHDFAMSRLPAGDANTMSQGGVTGSSASATPSFGGGAGAGGGHR